MGRVSTAALGALFMGFIVPVSAPAQLPSSAAADEIVVTARRTGIPVWRVTGPKTSIVLVGSIDGVVKETRWDPGALTETLRKADQVMFPGLTAINASPFALIRYYMRFRKQATLPKGQSLQDFVPPQQFDRLVALKNRGVLKAGFERKHPFHLAMELRDKAKGKSSFGLDADGYVRKAVQKHKLKMVPLRTIRAKPVVNDYFAASPRNFVPCLVHSITLAEAGPAAIKARSDAWAARRVPEVIASPADEVYASCSAGGMGIVPSRDLSPQIAALLSEPKLTVAVVNLRPLAARGGVLDDLKAAGFAIQGPSWRR